MYDLPTTIDTYLSALNEADPERRIGLIALVWASNGQLIDPPLIGTGHDGIGSMAVAMQAQFPGHQFRRVSGVDTHHGYLRFAWELVDPDGSVVVSGLDVGELAPDGRLQRVTGFFGALPALESAS